MVSTFCPGVKRGSFGTAHSNERKYFEPEEWENQGTSSGILSTGKSGRSFTRNLPRYFEGSGADRDVTHGGA